MWESIKKDPLLKTIIVVLIGVLAFGLAFNIMFGAGGSSMEESSMMSSGYSLSNSLENLIGLLIKVVIIGLLISVIVWIFRSITKQTGSIQTDRLAFLKEDPIIRKALIIIGAVVVLLFGFWFLRGIAYSGNYGEMTNHSGGSTYPSGYLSYSFTSLFALILKTLIIVLLITLAYGLVMYFKENYAINTKVIDTSKIITKDCPECKSKVNDGWKCCPYCGSDKAFGEADHEEHKV